VTGRWESALIRRRQEIPVRIRPGRHALVWLDSDGALRRKRSRL